MFFHRLWKNHDWCDIYLLDNTTTHTVPGVHMLYTIAFLFVSIISACNPKPLELSAEMYGCENQDFSEQEDSVLEIEKDGSDLLVRRTNVLQNCDAVFTPTFETDQWKVYIREYWTSEDNSCQSCFSPTIRIANYEGDSLEFWWYLGDDSISFNVIDSSSVE